ncbi:DUF397 domain-containing protein [Streptomyces sp. NPDC058625]|uniref:DUF397 domain-containing protein n=1 Tax=Streptomyces sp. NPDC058625 TaxID=3346564 RepID=UPI00364A853B
MRPAGTDLNHAAWRKSAYSNGQGGDCLELVDSIPGTVPVRDSKNPTGTILLIGTCAWAAFIDGIRTSGR